jgi:dihydropyrimidine dehydrogenase (NAD+) subunit PreA
VPDLSVTFAGVRAPNPFWLASGPPTNRGEQIVRAFDHGWGGAVWKTLHHERDEVVNVAPRLAGLRGRDGRLVAIHNIELISDRPLAESLRELAAVKRRHPDRALVASVMTGERWQWEELIRQCEEAGADAFELNFGCPHGMTERGQGAVVGQDPKTTALITRWAKSITRKPVLVKLTPNVTDILVPGRAAVAAGADALVLINTVRGIPGVDLDALAPYPAVGGRSTPGGLAGPAVKPIALAMVAALARDPETRVPISGLGGIATWRDAAEFMLLGASTVQVCAAVMAGGYRIVRDMLDGLSDWMAEKGFRSGEDFIGRALPNLGEWRELDPARRVAASIDPGRCIGCQLCFVACRDGGHQAIVLPEVPLPANGAPGAATDRRPTVDPPRCVGCGLCAIVCPVPGCVTLNPVEPAR